MARFDPVDIGEAARLIGVSTATLRLYERRGLLPKTARSAGGYRQYSTEDLRRARLVWRARRAGLSMRQIAQALGESNDATALRRLLREHADHLDREGKRIARLHRHLCRWLGGKFR
jgi:DNA-binding transcriptional MerR regulator